MKEMLAFSLVSLYNMTILAGAIWLIGWCDWNPWWMLLAVCLQVSFKYKDEK
jgi:hypothetical protein